MSANNVNRWVGTGTLTRDPEPIGKGDTPAGCRFSIASNERFKKRDSDDYEEYANFFDCVAWGGVSSPILRFLTKGSKVILDGKLKQERWEHEGQKRSKVSIHVQNVEFGAKPSAGTSSGSSSSDDGFDSGSAPEEDDDIPFVWRPVDAKPMHEHNPFG